MEKERKSIKSNWLVIFILVVHFALGVFYSIAVPIWEANDEWGHYEFVRYVAREHHLPPPGVKLVKYDETHQPPLYYILCGLITSWIDTSDNLKPTPNAFMWTPKGGINKTLPPKEAAIFPYQGTVLSIHMARLVSVLLSTVTIWATYLIGCTVFPGRKEIVLSATAINAFWPQFLFIGSVVTNDIMVILCSSFFLLFLVRILIHGPRALDMLGLGLCLGGALLSKRNGGVLIPLAGVGLAIAVIRRVKKGGRAISILGGVVCFLIGAGLISAWWSKGLWERYDGHVRFAISLLLHPYSIRRLPWGVLPDALPYGFRTFWACFGWANINVEEQVYKFVAFICLSGSIGVLVFFIKSKDRSAKYIAMILICHLLLAISALIYLMLLNGMYYALQGRCVLLAISSASLLLSLGLANVIPKRFSNMLAVSVGVAMFAYALLVPFRYILPTYAKPRLLSPADIQALENPLGLHFSDRIELVGYELAYQEVTPHSEIPVTLYWRCLGEMERNYILAVKVVGWDHQVYGGLHLHPGRGNFPTSLWREGDLFRETYWVPVEAPETVRTLARVSVSFFRDNSSSEYLPVRDPHGGPPGGSALFGRIKIAGTPPRPVPSHKVSSQVGDHISLIGYDLPQNKALAGKDVGLTLYWEARDRVVEDYTVFVHLVSGEGEIVAQGDGPPVGGGYPTGLWEGDEVIADRHIIHLPPDLPSGRYHILAGLYSLDTLVRLPALTFTGERLTADAIHMLPTDSLTITPK